MTAYLGSIKDKLVRIQTLSMGSVLLLLLLCMLGFEYQVFSAQLGAEIQTQADMTCVNSAPAILFGDRPAVTEVLAALRYSDSIRRATVTLPDGQLFADW